ncbi:MAG: hypothetical protein HRT59_22920 [Crocosphaera sp.]|nr:hypothetical protein [Crocosphaera sp.]
MIAGAYFQNNEVSKAESIIEEEMGKSDAKGWDLNWDGGSRQKLFKLLVQRDKDKWRPIALRSLVDDYIGEYRYSSNMVLNLKYFFELFFEKNSLLKLWTEIKSHIYELDVFTESEKLPTINSSAPAQQENLNHLVTLSFYVLDLIIPELAEKAHLTIISLSKTPSNLSTIFDEINKRLAEVGLSQVKAMSLLFNLTKLHPHCTAMFESAISKLTQSPDFSVRIMALELASSLNIKPEPIQSNHPKLPFIYQLELPKFINKEEAISYSSLRPGDTLPDIDDPIELIRPFSTEFELISKISGIPFENILHRAKDFMFSLSSEDKWNRQAEESFRNWMDGVNLKFTYPRLRPQIAKLAMSYIISELVDAGYLPHDETLLATIVLRTDNKLLNLMPQSRPDYIIIPNLEESELNSDRKEWIEKIDINSPYFVTDNEVGRCVLGELSKWVWLDWAVPTEIRMTMICSPDYSAQYEVEGPSSFFPHSLYWNSEDYPHNLYDNPHSLVIYGSGSYIDHGNSKWIALNPHIGISLGWSVSEDGLFRWVNNVGDVMVESFCWKDGPINRHPPKMDDICSEGWLVLASPEAEQAIRKHVHSAIKKCSVVREVKDGSSLALNTAEKQTKW